MRRQPEVIEELNLDNGLQSTGSHANRSANDVRFGQRRIEHSRAPEFALQVGSNFEDATLAFYLVEKLFPRAVGDVFAKDDDARIALHLRMQATIDQIDHRARIAAELGPIFGVEHIRSRIDVR